LICYFRYQDPFEEYKKRLAKKLARKAEANNSTPTQTQKPGESVDDDGVNWFGVKVGTGSSAFGRSDDGGAVGKYLNIKRPLGSASDSDSKKKRKIGFGDFEGW
jgi:peptidyl-prolyl cis-trans isomerase-like protein 2